MTSDSWPGVARRLGRGAFAAGLIALGSLQPSAPGALGASVEFQGELNYDTFKRASDKGVGIRITRSPGGTGAAAMVLGRTKGLVIDGRCQSACAWAFVQNENACFTKRASFDFHAAHDPGTGRRLAAATDYWLSTVGPELRARLQGLKTSSSLIRVSAKEMARYYGGRQCGAGGPRAEIETNKPKRQAALPSATPVALGSTTLEEAGRITTASIAPRTAWSVADTQAGIESVRIAQANGGIIFASLLTGAQTFSSDAPAQGETSTALIGHLIPSLSSGNPAQLSAAWPEATYAMWEGIVMSVAPSVTELAARRDGALSDG